MTSTFYLDIFIDFNRFNRPSNLEKAIATDVYKINQGDVKDNKFCSLSCLMDTGASANLIPYDVVKRCMPKKLQDIIKTPDAEITSANKSKIEVVGRLCLDFSLVAYPLLAKSPGKDKGIEVRFKDIVP